MAVIRLKGLRYRGFHGVLEEERKLGQEFIVDLNLTYDSRPAIRHDEIELAVNYAHVERIVKEIVQGTPFRLLESLADRVAEQLLQSFPPLKSVDVTIHKPCAPIEAVFDDLNVEIQRSRAE